ncbi:hypothetical protein [Pseudomonas sp. PLMAX]|uniref:hypothetical protein n=1 Tax=Pseudomonas sp. PLMAX TaxID=2201998 RepID=UPI0038BC1EC5
MNRKKVKIEGNTAVAGAGLVLSRRVGERIFVTANPKASDEEILAAAREGVMITLVEVTATGRRHFTTEVAGQQQEEAPKGTARIGLKCSNALTLMREEIIPGEVPDIARAYG